MRENENQNKGMSTTYTERVNNLAAYHRVNQECSDCYGMGVVYAHSKESPRFEYAFRCQCSAGDIMQFPYPKWTDSEFSDRYILDARPRPPKDKRMSAT